MVFPCVPATAIEIESDINSASALARVISVMPELLPACRSKFSGFIAFEKTIRSAPSIFSALCPMKTFAPSARRASRTEESDESEPET